MVHTKFRVLKDGEIEFVGNAKEIKEKYGMRPTASITYYAFTGCRIWGEYEVQFDEQDNHLIWQTRNLDMYGNTVNYGKIEENLAELEELGYICEAKPFYMTDGKRRKTKHYVLKLKGKKCTI